MTPIIYNVPAALMSAYRGCPLIVRAQDPAELLSALLKNDLDKLVYVQLVNLPRDVDLLARWPTPAPVDLRLANPAADFPLLYRYSKLLDNHPVRVSLPVTPGFSKAAQLAVALQFAVKLEITRLDAALIEELNQVLDLYLHRASVAQPIDYFHSSLLAFYRQQPVTLWTIQEEDPAAFRWVTDQGEETLAGRLAGTVARGDKGAWVERLQRTLLAWTECGDCEFFAYCGGYFKWPCPRCSCNEVKPLFGRLQQAATELRRDLADFAAAQGETLL